ncbi:Maob [Phodopus roborovskii]|uniref:Maob protein n=1 Tax=Phodopus roborovskii TaxID=109678 RepID=A0AAU9YZX7_PHORO|nr:Maob [Phodopus roborovskii]
MSNKYDVIVVGGGISVSPWPQVGDWKRVEGLVLDFELFLQEC